MAKATAEPEGVPGVTLAGTGYDASMAAHYDADWDSIGMERPDVAFYRSLVPKTRGPIADIAAGTGRVTLPVAQAAATRRVYAVEPSPGMRTAMDRRLANQPGVSNIEVLPGRFGDTGLPSASIGYALSAFRSFQHLLCEDAQSRALSEIRRIVRPGGLFAMDLFEAEDALRCDAPEVQMARSAATTAGTWRVRRDRRSYDDGSEIMTVTMRWRIEDDDGRVIRDLGSSAYAVRCMSRPRLGRLLQDAGWDDYALYSDFRRTRLGREPRDIVVVARRS